MYNGIAQSVWTNKFQLIKKIVTINKKVILDGFSELTFSERLISIFIFRFVSGQVILSERC